MYHTLRANWRWTALCAEVANLLLRVVLAEISYRTIWLVQLSCIWCLLMLLGSLTAGPSMAITLIMLIPSILVWCSLVAILVQGRWIVVQLLSARARWLMLHHLLLLLLRLLSDFLSQFKELSCWIWVQYSGTLAELTDNCFECILVLCGLLLQVESRALETQVVIACED